jgi:hypothetical protein
MDAPQSLVTEEELAKLGPDTQIKDLDQDTVILNVHLTNYSSKNPKEFKDQVIGLKSILDKLSSKIVIVTGDFNAQLLLEDNNLNFYSKDIEIKNGNEVTSVHNLLKENPEDSRSKLLQDVLPFTRPIYLGVPPAPTTNKVRIITTQLDKILKPVASKIDWCFVVLPEGDQRPVTISSVSKIDETPVNATTFSPLTWCSDHFMLETDIDVGTKHYRIGSLNILGMSKESGDSYNHFEFADNTTYHNIQEYKMADRIKEILDKFLDDFIVEITDPNRSDQLTRIYKKFFSKKNPDGTFTFENVTRESIKKNKVFGLQPATFLNVHYSPVLSNELKGKALAEYNNRLSFVKNSYNPKPGELALEDVLFLSEKVYAFFQSLYTDKVEKEGVSLNSIFTLWADEINMSDARKVDYNKQIESYLQFGRFDAFALQEVSASAMYDALNGKTFPGYKPINITKHTPGKKTTGALIIKEAGAETAAPKSSGVVSTLVPMLVMWHTNKNKIIGAIIAAIILAIIIFVIVHFASKFTDYSQANFSVSKWLSS